MMASADVPTFSFLVCGRTGIGKSTLVNILIGKELCEVNDPGLEGGNFDPCSVEMKVVSKKLNGIVINVWDSPGLEDGVRDDKVYINKMEETCGKEMENIDVILYCTDMTVARLPSEIIAMKALTERFGEVFWKKSVFVMTKGNAVGFQTAKAKFREYHKNVYCNLKKTLSSQLIKLGVSQSVAESVPAVVTGYIDVAEETEAQDPNRYLLYVSDQIKETKPPTRHDFLPEMWVTCFKNIVSEKARGYFWDFSGKDRIMARADKSPALDRIEKASQEKNRISKKLSEKLKKVFKSKKHNSNTNEEGSVEEGIKRDTEDNTNTEEGGEGIQNIKDASKLYLDDDQLTQTAEGLEAVVTKLSQLIVSLDEE